MRILVAWDNPEETELFNLYLGSGEHETCCTFTGEELMNQANQGYWHVVLMSLAFPKSADESFPWFKKIQETLPGVPVVMACRPTEMVKLMKFMTNGLRFHLMRDDNKDYIFLLLSTLESAVSATLAEEASKLADRLREEMDGVRKLQESIIPKGLVPPPGYEVVARYEPSQVQVVGGRPVVMAGGDYYDMFQMDKKNLVLLIGDASGHGLKACMAIMAMHTLVRMIQGERYQNTASFVSEINRRLCDNSIVQSEGGFITLFYASIDTEKNVMHWTSAGHPLGQLHLKKDNKVLQVGSENDTGLPLAVVPEADYQENSFEIPQGSRLILYTDGLTDAIADQAPSHKIFGVQGIVEALQTAQNLPLPQALEHLFEESKRYTGNAGRHDDTSVLLLERL